MRSFRYLLLVALAVAAGALQLHAGGPLNADNTTPRRYASASFPLTYRVDQGTLGSFSNTLATAIVGYSFWEWDSVQSAALSFTQGAQLGRDVNTGTDAYITGNGQWSDGINPIVFDTDGSITDAKLGTGAKSSVLGFAGSAWTGTTFVEGYAIINGYLSGSGSSTDEDRYKATIVHEIGHFLGLAHSQVTMHADFATMYPIIQKTAMKAISPDDTAAIAWLYPASGHTTRVGSISGTVKTPANANLSGVVVLAIDSATSATYSTVVDYFSGGNGSFTNPPSASGSYTISGLPPGRYYVRIEPAKTQFTGGSSLASYSTPQNTGIAREWYNGAGESGDMLLDDQNQKTAVSVTAGSTTSGINIVSNESATLSTLSHHNATASATWALPFGSYTGYAVRYTAPVAGSLVGVKVRMEAGSTMPLTGTVTFTVHANTPGSLAGIPGTVLGSVTIPYTDLSSNQDNDIWLRGIGLPINFTAGTDFHVAITTNGVGTIALQSDNGATTQNRTSYYTSANGWRNMPQGMSASAPGYNLHMSAIYSTSLAGNPTPGVTVTPTSIDFGRSRPNLTVDRVVTIANPGTASLAVSAAAFAGVDASAFSIVSGGAPFSVAPGASHQLTLRWTSRRGGTAAKSASLSLTSNAPTSPSVVTLAGTVIEPVASKLMASVALGSRRLDSTHTSSHTVLRNTGNDTLNVSSIVLSGADAGTGIRLISSGSAPRLAPDSTLTVRLEFLPTARRTYAATLTVGHDDSTGSTSFAVSGTGIAPLVTSSADSLDHGSVRVQNGGNAELWLRNSGNTTMSVSGFSSGGADSSAFQVLMPSSLPMTIAAGDSTLVRVRFAPIARRAYAATLRVQTDAIPATKTLALSGRGIAPVASAPSLAVIGAAPVGGSIEASALAIRNLGDAPLAVTGLAIGGAHATEFTVVGATLPATIAPGDSLPVRIRLMPTIAGTRTADLVATTDDPQGTTTTVTLTGSGLQGRLSLASGARLDFGDVTMATAADRAALLTNSGTAPLTVSSMTLAGAASIFSVQLPSLPLTIQPGDTVTLPVRFAPATAGVVSARVAMISNGAEPSVELELVGRGVAPGLALSRSAILFGAVPTGQSRVDSFVVRNTGALPLTNVTATLTGASAGAFEIVSPTGAFTVVAGSSQPVVVRLAAQSAAGPLAAGLRVTATGGAESLVDITATVVESMLETASQVDFGTRLGTDAVDTMLVVRNTGTMPLRIDSVSAVGERDGSRGQFFLASASATTIAPGSQTEIRLRFNPFAGIGAYLGALTIYTNNPPDSAFTVPLRGMVAAPAGFGDPTTGNGVLRLGAVRPNPSSSDAWITVYSGNRVEIVVTVNDLRGRKVLTLFEGETYGEDHLHIDASLLDPGEYMLTMTSAAGVVAQRFVVLR